MEVDQNNIETRNYKCELGLLTRSDGSAVLSQDGTIMIACINGPVEAKHQKMFIDKCLVEAHFRPNAGQTGVADRLKESVIRNTCETALMAALYPRTCISVVIQEVQNKGEVLSCSINAACLALLDSGLEMKYLVGAVTCAVDVKDNLIINPPHLIFEKAKATFTFVFESIHKNIVAVHTTGIFSKTQYEEAEAKCQHASNVIFKFYRNMMSNKIKKKSNKENYES